MGRLTKSLAISDDMAEFLVPADVQVFKDKAAEFGNGHSNWSLGRHDEVGGEARNCSTLTVSRRQQR